MARVLVVGGAGRAGELAASGHVVEEASLPMDGVRLEEAFFMIYAAGAAWRLDAWRRELAAPGGVQLAGWPAVLAEQPTDAVGGTVALVAGVDEQGPPAGSTEDQGGGQSCGSATHDDAVPMFAHDSYGTEVARVWQTLLPTWQQGSAT